MMIEKVCRRGVVWMVVVLAAASAASGCSSGGVSTGQAVPPTTVAVASSPAASATASAQAAGGGTRTVELAPVDAQGRPAPGWQAGSAHEDPAAPIDCGGDGVDPMPSPAAVSAGIYLCAPAASTADTCWRGAQPLRMLCLLDPFSKSVEQFAVARVAGPVAAPAHPVPLGLVLADGSRCRLRDGGAWGSPRAQPDLVGYYSCGQRRGVVWARAESPTGGIDLTEPTWTVLVGEISGPLTTVGVTTAYFAANA